MIEHGDDPLAADITLTRAINGIAGRHIVRAHRLRNGPGCAADPKKPASDLLSGADLSERGVQGAVEVDLQRLLMCSENFSGHSCASIAVFSQPDGLGGPHGSVPRIGVEREYFRRPNPA